jgi:hypothetical protein
MPESPVFVICAENEQFAGNVFRLAYLAKEGFGLADNTARQQQNRNTGRACVASLAAIENKFVSPGSSPVSVVWV